MYTCFIDVLAVIYVLCIHTYIPYNIHIYVCCYEHRDVHADIRSFISLENFLEHGYGRNLCIRLVGMSLLIHIYMYVYTYYISRCRSTKKVKGIVSKGFNVGTKCEIGIIGNEDEINIDNVMGWRKRTEFTDTN